MSPGFVTSIPDIFRDDVIGLRRELFFVASKKAETKPMIIVACRNYYRIIRGEVVVDTSETTILVAVVTYPRVTLLSL